LSTWSEPIPANTAPPREELELTGGGAISLEPGGQFELTGAPVENVHQTCSELMAHLAQVKQIAAPLGIGFLGPRHDPQLEPRRDPCHAQGPLPHHDRPTPAWLIVIRTGGIGGAQGRASVSFVAMRKRRGAPAKRDTEKQSLRQ
jgi:Glutamate-cysteine ligase family 2(GCS2)